MISEKSITSWTFLRCGGAHMYQMLQEGNNPRIKDKRVMSFSAETAEKILYLYF